MFDGQRVVKFLRPAQHRPLRLHPSGRGLRRPLVCSSVFALADSFVARLKGLELWVTRENTHQVFDIYYPLYFQSPPTPRPDAPALPDHVVGPDAADIAAGVDTELSYVLKIARHSTTVEEGASDEQ